MSMLQYLHVHRWSKFMVVAHQPSQARCVALRSKGLQDSTLQGCRMNLIQPKMITSAGMVYSWGVATNRHSNLDVTWLLYHHHLCIYYLSYKLGT